MPPPVRLPVREALVDRPRPAEIALSLEELAAATGLSPARIERLVQLGLVESTGADARPFSAATAARLRCMLRLHRDLGVNFEGAAIITDLVERLEALERELTSRRP